MQVNQIIITGEIIKIYPLIYTPNNAIVSRFILKHLSEQYENLQIRNVYCRLFCVQIGSDIDDGLLNNFVEIQGFLNTNSQKQLIVHINKIRKLN